MIKRSATVLLAIGLTLIVSACSPTTGPSTSVQVNLTDFAFVPNRITVPAGEEITLRITNSGAVAHDLTIMKQGHELTSQDHASPDMLADAYWQAEQVPAGTSVTSTFMAPVEPGEYQIICALPGHMEAGMIGRLIVIKSP